MTFIQTRKKIRIQFVLLSNIRVQVSQKDLTLTLYHARETDKKHVRGERWLISVSYSHIYAMSHGERSSSVFRQFLPRRLASIS
jgi:hypothetical protein